MFSHAQLNPGVSRIHWTARVGFYLSFFVVMVWYIPHQFHLEIPSFLLYVPYYIYVLLPLPALIVSCIALFLSTRSSWRRGREFALLGLLVSGILCVEMIQLFFFHMPIFFG